MITTTSPDRLQHIAVLGLGRSGIAATRLAYERGLTIWVFDDRSDAKDQLSNASDTDWLASCWKDPSNWDFEQLDALILSPGIPHSYPQPHPAASAAIAANVPILSDIELTIRLQEPSKWVVITGTNGKSTTTALVGHMLTEVQVPNIAGGNLGPALAGCASPGQQGVRVVEMSSYQLERTPSLKADASVILNITPDHLDRHGGMAGYITAKEQAILSLAPDGLCLLGAGSELDLLSMKHDHCVRIKPEMTPPSVRKNPALQGAHNLQNIAAAMAICTHLGVSEADCIKAIWSFAGLPHRLQPCGDTGKLRFINDSKATNGEAASKAIAAFTNIYWLAGGMAKEDGLQACLAYKQHIIAAYFYGQDADRFASEATGHFPNRAFTSMDEALNAAVADAESDATTGTILLSPAAASFDQFSSFEERGNSFMQKVAQLTTLSQQATSNKTEVSHA